MTRRGLSIPKHLPLLYISLTTLIFTQLIFDLTHARSRKENEIRVRREYINDNTVSTLQI